MDHCGDMAFYIQRGLRAFGHKGVLGFDPNTTEPLRDLEDLVFHEDGTVEMNMVWGKDMPFKLTIQEINVFAIGKGP